MMLLLRIGGQQEQGTSIFNEVFVTIRRLTKTYKSGDRDYTALLMDGVGVVGANWTSNMHMMKHCLNEPEYHVMTAWWLPANATSSNLASGLSFLVSLTVPVNNSYSNFTIFC